jgi:hypothetical protein
MLKDRTKLTQIAIRRLPRQHQRFRQMFAQLQDMFEMCLGLVVLAQFVVHYAQFVVDQRIFGTHFQGLVEIRLAQTHVVGTQVLHPRAQHRNVASGKQPLRGTVGRHGLVRFVLGREGVAKTNPSRCKRFFFRRGFRKIPAGQFKFPNRVVVTPHRIP